LICSLAFLIPLSAFADEGDKVFVGATIGSGGNFEGDWESDSQLGPLVFQAGDDIDADMETSWGGFLHYDTPVHRLLSLGGRMSVLSFITEDMADEDWSRNWALNFDFAPRVNFRPSALPIGFYATTPIGLSFLLPSEDWDDEAGLDFDVGISWNLSVLGGIDFMVADDFGIFVEGGWLLQNVNWEGQSSDGNTDVALDGDFGQLAINLGLALAL
jgi:hypothetical protein